MVATTMTGASLVVTISLTMLLTLNETPAMSLPSPPPVATRRRAVTSLFVDVVDSMSLCSSLPLDDWWSVMEQLFELLTDGVERFGGWVESLPGDGVVAVFGLRDEADHAQRACDAARWIAERTEHYARELDQQCGLRLAVRIGVNSGEIVVGAVRGGSHARTVTIGHALGLAKRIESFAAPGSICIGETTAELLGDSFRLLDLGSFHLRGAGRQVRLFELSRARGSLPNEHRGERPVAAVAA